MIRIHFHMFVYTQTLEMWNPPYSGRLGDGTAIACRKCSQVAGLIYPWISYIWFILCTHMGCLSAHIPQLHSSGVTNASCSGPDHWPQQKPPHCKLTLSPHCKLMPSSSRHSPTCSSHPTSLTLMLHSKVIVIVETVSHCIKYKLQYPQDCLATS